MAVDALAVVHALPNRARLRFVAQSNHEITLEGIVHLLTATPGILSAEANPITQRLLVTFNGSHYALPTLLNRLLASIQQTQALTRGTEAGHRSEQKRHWHQLPETWVLACLHSSDQGILESEVPARRLLWGSNLVRESCAKSAFSILIQQFSGLPVTLLGASAVVSALTGGVADALAIVCVLIINAAIGFTTEQASQKTLLSMQGLKPGKVKVRRNGHLSCISAIELVPGDQVLIKAGDTVPADIRLLHTEALSVDESVLTGESEPTFKTPGRAIEALAPIAERSNMAYAMTQVIGGSGRGIVVATGTNTEVGLLQDMMLDIAAPSTPLERQIDELGARLVGWSTLACIAFAGLGVLRGLKFGTLLKSALSLGIAAIPEGLPTVMTTTLTLGIREMRRQNILVRQLRAAETLGAIQVLCLDKTGTLTLNKMRGVAIRTPNRSLSIFDGVWHDLKGQPLTANTHPEIRMLFEMVVLCSQVGIGTSSTGAIELEGSPTECALVDMAFQAGVDAQAWRNRNPRLEVFPRTALRPYMTSVHERRNQEGYLMAVKGSPENVLDLCDRWLSEHRMKPLNERIREKILAANHDLAGDSLRVLGVAFKHVEQLDDKLPQGLVWLGLIALEDVLRPGVEGVIHDFHEAGIQTLMLTGDQKRTAEAIGDHLGLGRLGASLKPSSPLKDTSPIYSRVSPKEKLRIVRRLQAAGLIVAMTGDGINDGPALKAADVGITLGQSGHSAARSVADVILTQDDLKGVVTAIRQGRTLYRNIRKSLRFLISTNLSEIEVMCLVMLTLGQEALSPMQLLWINLVTDVFPALALAMEGPEADVLKEPPRDPWEPILNRTDLRRIFRESLIISTFALIPAFVCLRQGHPKTGSKAPSLLFFSLVCGQLFHTLSCRSEKQGGSNPDRLSNPAISWAVCGGLLLQAAAFRNRTLAKLLALTPLARAEVLAGLLSACGSLWLNESLKVSRSGKNRSLKPQSAVPLLDEADKRC